MEELKNRLKVGENIHDLIDRVDDINGDIAIVYSRTFGWNLLKYETKEIDKVNYADSINWSEDVTESDGTASDKSESKASGTSEGTTTHTLNRVGKSYLI